MSGGHNFVFKEPGLRKWADNFAFGVMIGRCVVQLHFVGLTLAITWPQVVKAEVFCLAEAAQVNGGVREWQECQVQQEVTTAQSPSP